MNTVAEINLVKVQSELSYLGSLKPMVDSVRERFYNYALTLQYPINDILLGHFNERIKRAGDTPMLGEYAVFVWGSIFSISEKVIKESALPWFLLYEYCLLLDDLLDKYRPNWSLELLASQVLIDKSLREYVNIINYSEYLFKTFEKFREQSISSMIYEFNWSATNITENIETAHNIQGRKSALMKFCISCLLIKENRRELNEMEERALDSLCAGIQLLDDLTDVFEDHKEGRMNTLLQNTYKWININSHHHSPNLKQNKINIDQLIIGLVYSGSLNNTLEIAAELIDKTSQLNYNNKQVKGINFLKNMSLECRNSSKKLDELLIKNSEYKQSLLSQILNSNQSSILTFESNELDKFWQQIKEYLKTIPKASN